MDAMSTRVLRRVNGKTQLVVVNKLPPPSPSSSNTQANFAPSSKSRQPFHHASPASFTVLPQDGKTESADSEEAEASTSLILLDSNESLEDAFPSVLKLLDYLSRAYHDPNAFRSSAKVFVNSVSNITACIAASEHVDPTQERFVFAKSIVHLLLNIFTISADRVAHTESSPRLDLPTEMRAAYEYARLVLDSLAVLFRIGLKAPLNHKPLPPLPQSLQTIHSLASACLREAKANHEVKKVANGVGDADRAKAPPDSPIFPKFKFSNIVQGKFKGSETTRSRTDSSSSSSAKRPPPSPPTPSDSILEGPRSEAMYNQRRTVLYFGETNFPSIVGNLEDGTDGLRMDKDSRIQAASLAALVRILTSKEGVKDPNLSQAILRSFRLFSTSSEFFGELKKRYDVKTPSNLGKEEIDHWRVKSANIHARVLAVIFTWLDQHWETDSDTVILGDVCSFVGQRTEKDLPRGVINNILAKIKEREQCSDQDILDKQKRDIAATSATRTPSPERTNFGFPSKFPNSSSDGIAYLDTNKDGREELARHLTLKMSDLYRKLDPIKAVRFWYRVGESSRDYHKFKSESGVKELAAVSAYGERLTLWVIWTIVEVADVRLRERRLSFWLDVASRCMNHRDYATAHNIYVCLGFSSIIRMKETILRVPYASKVQYKRLADFFDDKHNTLFRRTFNNLLPSLPSTAPLLRDIIQVKTRIGKEKGTLVEASGQKLITIKECRVTQQATKVLNKALIEYKFYRNDSLLQWLEKCTMRFCFVANCEKQNFYDEAHKMSREIEARKPELDFVSNPWKFKSTCPDEPLKGKIMPLDKLFAIEPSAVEQKKNAKRLFSLLNDLKDSKLQYSV